LLLTPDQTRRFIFSLSNLGSKGVIERLWPTGFLEAGIIWRFANDCSRIVEKPTTEAEIVHLDFDVRCNERDIVEPVERSSNTGDCQKEDAVVSHDVVKVISIKMNKKDLLV
jgi:hypothetical protein